jgi:hypothetical protein
MFEILREISSKFKIVLGLGISGLVSLIGYGFRNYTVGQNQWLKAILVQCELSYQMFKGQTIFRWGEQWYLPDPQGRWFWMGVKEIYPLWSIGIVLTIIGVVVFVGTLAYINYLQLYKKKGNKE